MNRIFSRTMLLCCFVAGLVPLAAGCGGGVASETTVSVKRDKTEADGGDKTGNEAAPAGGAPASGFGSFKGRVVFQGNAPSLPLILKAGAPVKDPICSAVELPNERLVVGSGNGVANVFVYLAKPPAGAKPSPPPSEPVVFDQKGCKFIPHALLVRAGQKVLILNDDPVTHNTHTYPNRSSGFNSSVNPKERKGVETVYAKQENNPIEVKCDFHAWMIAYHLPIDHPFAALTGPDGSFEIKDLPTGTHKFLAWHEGCSGGYLTRTLTVSIKAGEETTQEIPYAADKLK